MQQETVHKPKNHLEIIANLTSEEKILLTSKTDIHAILRLASQFFCLLGTSIWIMFALPGWQFALICQGILIVFLFTLLHETSHYTAFKTKRLNTIIGWLCAVLIILPPNWFRYFHLAHHRHTHVPNKDPELEGNKPNNWQTYITHVSGIPIWYSQLKTLFMNAFGKVDYDYLPKARIKTVIFEARIMLAAYFILLTASTYLSNNALVWLWLIPIVCGQPFLRLYLMAEHGRCPHVFNMLENTRTTFTNSLVRWIAWNMPYHAEHHAYPNVPFHKLAKFNAIIKDDLRIIDNGYIAFHKKYAPHFNTTSTD